MSALVQQTEEWKHLRKNKIGASDAPIIMELSPWRTPYQLWEEKVGISKGQETNDRMKRGLDLEEKARKKFEEKTGIMMFPQVVFHPNYNWMMASLDGMDIEQKYVLEIKCAGKEDHSAALDGEIPKKYYPQLQHQLEVCGLDLAYYFSFDGDEGVILECRRDTRYIKNMITKEQEFYKCIQDFTAPDLTERDYQYKNDEVWQAAAIEWMMVQKKLREFEKRDKELRDILISMSNGQNSTGAGINVCKMARKGTIQYNMVPELQGVDLEPYRKEPIELWRITRS